MADESRLARIQRVYQVVTRIKRPSGKVYEYLVWHGFYCENCGQKKVYLGKDLPERFKHLLEGKRRSETRGQYYWPASYHRDERGDTGFEGASDR